MPPPITTLKRPDIFVLQAKAHIAMLLAMAATLACVLVINTGSLPDVKEEVGPLSPLARAIIPSG